MSAAGRPCRWPPAWPLPWRSRRTTSTGWRPWASPLLSAAVLGASWRLAGPLGLTAGLAFFVPTLSWYGVYVGALPWIALCVLQSLYIAAMTALTAAVQRPLLATRLRPLAYAAVPVFWVLQETARSHTPSGASLGPPRVQPGRQPPRTPCRVCRERGSHAAAVARWGRCSTPGGPCSSGERAAAPAPGTLGRSAPALAGGAAGGRRPAGTGRAAPDPADGRSARGCDVRPGQRARPGLEFNAERARCSTTTSRRPCVVPPPPGRRPTLVVWRENASDIDPLRNPDADAAIARPSAVRREGPILLGGRCCATSPMISNVSLFYRPGGGEPERYVKQHPVPFAEYIPFRSFFRAFSDKVDLVTADFTAGTGRGRSGYPHRRARPTGPSRPSASRWPTTTSCARRLSSLASGPTSSSSRPTTPPSATRQSPSSSSRSRGCAPSSTGGRSSTSPRWASVRSSARRVLTGQDLALHRRRGPWQPRGP